MNPTFGVPWLLEAGLARVGASLLREGEEYGLADLLGRAAKGRILTDLALGVVLDAAASAWVAISFWSCVILGISTYLRSVESVETFAWAAAVISVYLAALAAFEFTVCVFLNALVDRILEGRRVSTVGKSYVQSPRAGLWEFWLGAASAAVLAAWFVVTG